MDATTARRIGNVALALAILILLIAIGSKFGLLPPIVHLREASLVAMVLAVLARGFRRRGREIRPGA
jgi:uncharacterized membrane protein